MRDVAANGSDAAQQLRSYASHPQHGLHAGLQLAHEVLLRRIARVPLPAPQLLVLLRRVRILFCLLRQVHMTACCVEQLQLQGQRVSYLCSITLPLCRICKQLPAAASPAPRRRPLALQCRAQPLPRCFGKVEHTQRLDKQQDFASLRSLDDTSLKSGDTPVKRPAAGLLASVGVPHASRT